MWENGKAPEERRKIENNSSRVRRKLV